jgi:hypothetical protein
MKILSSILFAAIIFSCTKKNCAPEKNSACMDTFVFWGGDPAADGAGWYLADTRSGPKYYHILEMPDAFKSDSLPVHTCVTETDKNVICFCGGGNFHYYQINEIRRR